MLNANYVLLPSILLEVAGEYYGNVGLGVLFFLTIMTASIVLEIANRYYNQAKGA